MLRLVPLFLLLPLAALAESQAGLREIHTLSVSGVGEMKVSPDKADIQFTITRKSKDAAKAKKEADEVIDAVKKIAADNHIAAKDVRTIETSIQSDYEQREVIDRPTDSQVTTTQGETYALSPNGQKRNVQILTGYTVTHTVQMTLNDLDHLCGLFDSLVKAKIDQIDNITYGLKDEAVAKDQALLKALQDAKRKAALMAKTLGGQVGKAITVNESGTSYNPPVVPLYRKNYASDGAVAARAMEAAPAPTSPMVGDISVSSSVAASFELN